MKAHLDVRHHAGSILIATFLSAGLAIAQDSSSVRPILDPARVPAWFETGKFRSARWDGGPLEAEKGVLSGWPNFMPGDPRQVLQATRDWYNPKTVELLKTAHINWAWVTWSNGFSPTTERKQWDLLTPYIQACHQNKIYVAAYISVANMFWKDMLEHVPGSIAWVQRDFHGAPLFYGHPNRYMADIQNQEWLALQKARVLAAVNAGADALWIDNTFSYHGEEPVTHFIDALYAVASQVNPHFVIMSNYNRNIYTWGKLQNGVSTEDGQEPGYYTDKQPPYMVTNAGLVRYSYAIGEGWRPVSLEYGGRHWGDRMTTPMQPAKWQLSIAECAMYGASLEPYAEGLFLRDLYFQVPQAMEGWRAIGSYNAFLEKHESYYTHPQTLARVAVLSDATDFIVSYLNQISETNLNYDVIFNYQEPQEALLKRYKVSVLPNTNPLSSGWCAALAHWVKEDGGTLVVVQDASLFPPGPASAQSDFGLGQLLGISNRNIPETSQVRPQGKGTSIYLPKLPPATDLAALVKPYADPFQFVEVAPREAILSNVAYQPDERRVILHLLNYRQELAKDVRVRVRAPVLKVEVLSPDALTNAQATIQAKGQESEITIPELRTYDLVAIYLLRPLD